MSSWATSAMRRSRSVFEARSTAALAAFSQESVLVPTSSMILYTLSAMAGSFLVCLEVVLFAAAAFIALARRLEQPGRAHAPADAHGDDPPALLPPAQLVEQRPGHARAGHAVGVAGSRMTGDRKSTRLNSSHSQISYAVFCLKKKKKKRDSRARGNLKIRSVEHRCSIYIKGKVVRHELIEDV